MIKKLLFFACIVFAFAGCKDDDPEPTPSVNYYFQCKINGVEWTASSPLCTDTVYFGQQGFVMQNNTTGAANQFMLGVLSLPSSLWSPEAVYVDNAFNMYDMILTSEPVHLSVTHDSINHVISGTFAFRLADSWDTTLAVTISNGQFNMKY